MATNADIFGTVGAIGGGIAGLVVGYEISHDLVHQARMLSEQTDALSYAIRENPTTTYLLAMPTIMALYARIGNTCGTLLGSLFD